MSGNAQARVQLLVHPVLKGLTRAKVKEWDKKYDQYALQVQGQGEAEPIPKNLCIHSDVKDLIAIGFT